MFNIKKTVKNFDKLQELDRLYFGKWKDDFDEIYKIIRIADYEKCESSLKLANSKLASIRIRMMLMNKRDEEEIKKIKSLSNKG